MEIASTGELIGFVGLSIPAFEAPPIEPGSVVSGVIGLDGGSTSSKAVLVSEDGEISIEAVRRAESEDLRDGEQAAIAG